MTKIDTGDVTRDGRGRVSRRALITGAGVGAALVTTSALVPAAEAKPAVPKGEGAAARPAGEPVTPIGSAPLSGYTYRTACMYDFLPFNPASQRTWGGSGVYTAGAAGPLRATFELPPGALVRDVEWYVLNQSSGSVFADLYQFAAGTGTIYSLSATATIATNSAVGVARTVVPASSQGPFSVGSKLLASLSTPTDGTVQVNGVRVGYTVGSAATGLLPTPVRAYDSRSSGGKLAGGSTRTITLPSSIVAPGTTGVLANITATQGSGSGYLTVYPASGSVPTVSTVNFGTASIANAVTVGVSSARQIKVYASRSVHVIVDLTGTVS